MISKKHWNREGEYMRAIPAMFLMSIIVLASIGLFFQLTTNPLQLLLSLIKFIIIAGLLFTLLYFLFIRPNQNNQVSKKYKQAVKQSQKKYGKRYKKNKNKDSLDSSKKNVTKNTSHLRVIKGNKPKNNDHP